MRGDAVALDTSVAVELLRGRTDVTRSLGSFRLVCLPMPVVGELRYGALLSDRSTENLARVEDLIDRCTLLPVDERTAEHYARVRHDLKRAGTPIPENDVWIAAVCRRFELRLATTDQHFGSISELATVNPLDLNTS